MCKSEYFVESRRGCVKAMATVKTWEVSTTVNVLMIFGKWKWVLLSANELTNQLVDEIFMLKENGRDAATLENEIVKNGYLYNLIKKSWPWVRLELDADGKPVSAKESAGGAGAGAGGGDGDEEEKKGGGSALE